MRSSSGAQKGNYRILLQNVKAKIYSVIVAKCRNAYGPHCLFAVYVLGDMTPADKMEALLKSVSVPATPPFDGIYFCCEFTVPIGLYFESGRQPLERRVWQLWPSL